MQSLLMLLLTSINLERKIMTWGTLLLILLIIMLLGSIPVYPYSREWGYAPVGGVTTLLVIFLLLAVLGVIPISINNTGETVNIDMPNIEINEGQ